MTASVQATIKAAFAIVTVAGIIGNILVCLVVLLNKPMKTPMNYLLVNLAISDLMLLVFFTPTFLFRDTFVHPQGLTGDLLCVFLTGESFAWMGGYASAYFLVAIAIERYHAVTKPHHFGASITKGRLKLLVFLCWLFALSWNSIGFAVKRYDSNTGFCTAKWPTENSFRIYSLLCLLVLGVIPILTMCILYSKVVVSLWFKREVVQVNNQESERKRRMKATKMVLTVSLIYTLSWVPELTVFTIFAYAPQYVNIDIAYPASVAMVTVNSAVNPIIYTLHGERFRYFLKRLLFRCCRKKNDFVPPINWSATQFERDGVTQNGNDVTNAMNCVTLSDKRVTQYDNAAMELRDGVTQFETVATPSDDSVLSVDSSVTQCDTIRNNAAEDKNSVTLCGNCATSVTPFYERLGQYDNDVMECNNDEHCEAGATHCDYSATNFDDDITHAVTQFDSGNGVYDTRL